MSLHLITGHAGREHISAADHGAFNVALLLPGSYVLNAGNKFSAQVVTNNSIKISDGELIMQGRHVRLNPGETEEITIANGQQDYKRNDLIVARYTKDSTEGIESVAFVVIQGEPSVSDASDPQHVEGNILNGVLTADFPLYRVPLDGLNVGVLVPLFEVKDNFDKRINDIITGAQKVGNAEKFGGKKPDEYASADHKHDVSEFENFPETMPPSEHEHSASDITEGTFAGKVVGNETAVSVLADKQFRNIYAGTAELTSGTSALPTGDIYIQYE